MPQWIVPDYTPDTELIVVRGADDATSGANLAATLAEAEDLEPGGNARSATNKAVVTIPPGRYLIDGGLTISSDNNFLVVRSLTGNPADTIITSEGGADEGATVKQVAGTVDFIGLTIENTGSSAGNHALWLNADDNSGSTYTGLVFRHSDIDHATYIRLPVYGDKHIKGTWRRCKAPDGFAWRVQHTTPRSWDIAATMYDCEAGNLSIGGDTARNITGKFYRVKCGDAGFGACTGIGSPIDSSAYFEDCEAGDNSFAVGFECARTFVRVKGGNWCFGGTSTGNPGSFTGVAKWCEGTGTSFGSNGGMSGSLYDCRNLQQEGPMNLSGKLEGCDIAAVTTNFALNVIGSIWYQAQEAGQQGKNISIQYVGGGSGGTAVVSVNQTAITVTVEAGVTLSSTVVEAINNTQASSELVTAELSGEDAPVSTAAQSYLMVNGTDAITITDSGASVIDCTITTDDANKKSFNASSAKTPLIVHCRVNRDKGANVTNKVGNGSLTDGGCIVDADVSL